MLLRNEHTVNFLAKFSKFKKNKYPITFCKVSLLVIQWKLRCVKSAVGGFGVF